MSATLRLTFEDAKYPEAAPRIEVRNPRGLDEKSVDELIASLSEIAVEFSASSSPVLFELIEATREFLTARNVPELPCTVCLLDILDEDVFVRTRCYHYFHAICLGRYVEAAGDGEDASGRPCPVCREPLQDVK